jgi:hypothetical protein
MEDFLILLLHFVSPVLSGLMSHQLALLRKRRDEDVKPSIHFWIGLCFSIGFVWTRFALAHWPG